MGQNSFLAIAERNTIMLQHVKVAELCLKETRTFAPSLKTKFFMAEISAARDGLRFAESPLLDPVIQNRFWLPILEVIAMTIDIKWSERDQRVAHIEKILELLGEYRTALVDYNRSIFNGEALRTYLRKEEYGAISFSEFYEKCEDIIEDSIERKTQPQRLKKSSSNHKATKRLKVR